MTVIAILTAATVSILYLLSSDVADRGSDSIPIGAEPAIVRIVAGSSLEDNPEFLVPKVATVVIGVNNTVRWVNEDIVPTHLTLITLTRSVDISVF
jgi:hypothetical protein